MVSNTVSSTSGFQLEAYPRAMYEALAALTPQSLRGRGLRIPTPDAETYRLTTTHPDFGEVLIEASRTELSHSGGWLLDHRRDIAFSAELKSGSGIFHVPSPECPKVFQALRAAHQQYAETQEILSRQYQSALEAKLYVALTGARTDLIGYNSPTEEGRARFILEEGEFKTVVGTRVSNYFGFTHVKPYAKTYLQHPTLAHTDESRLARDLLRLVPHVIPKLRHSRDDAPVPE